MTDPDQPTAMADITHEHVRVDDAEVMLHRARAGGEHAILFLHGSGPGATGWSNWQYALPALATEFDCLAPDYCGFGDTTHPEEPSTDTRVWMRWRVRQMLGLLDTLGIERAHLVGNSMGGAVALGLLTEAPERFERVVLMGSGGVPINRPPSIERTYMATFYDDPTANALARLYSYFIYDIDAFADRLDAIVADRLDMALRPEVRRSFEAMFSGPVHPALADSSLRRISQPVLLVHGYNDTIIPVDVSHHLMHQLPDAQLHIFGRCGHWTQIEHADAFNTLVRAFLAGDM